MLYHARAGTSTAVARCVTISCNETSECPRELCTSEKNLFETSRTSSMGGSPGELSERL